MEAISAILAQTMKGGNEWVQSEKRFHKKMGILHVLVEDDTRLFCKAFVEICYIFILSLCALGNAFTPKMAKYPCQTRVRVGYEYNCLRCLPRQE